MSGSGCILDRLAVGCEQKYIKDVASAFGLNDWKNWCAVTCLEKETDCFADEEEDCKS